MFAHVQLLALENVSVSSTALSWSRSEDSQQTTSSELLLEQGVDLGVLFALIQNSLDVVGLLLVGSVLGRGGLSSLGDGLGVLERKK